MATQETTELATETTEETPDGHSSDPTPKGLREAKDRADQKANTYHAKAMSLAFGMVGLDVTEGIGKLILSAYEGEPDPEEIRAFAMDHGWTPPNAPQPEQEAETLRQTDQRLNQTTTVSRSETRSNVDEQIAEAQREGRWREVVRLQQHKFADVVARRFPV